MSTSPSKTLSASELTKLEHAFAADPSSDSYKPLAEAYLGLGRYMEAMVVCKKGVKAHATLAEPRLLLARVYAEQGKDRKALEEALGALQVQPQDARALRMVGALQLKTGEREAGSAHLLRALEAEPSDTETLRLVQQYGLEVPRAAAAPPVLTVVPAAPPSPAPARAGGPPVLQAVPLAPPAAPAQAPATAAARPAAVRAPAPQPAPARPAPRRAAPVLEEEPDEVDDVQDEADQEDAPAGRPVGGRRRASRTLALVLAAVLPLALGGYALHGRWSAQRSRDFKKHLSAATEQLKHDSYASYKKACEAAEAALELVPDSAAAHGYLAYAWAIRWGEHGGGDDARQKAEEHLAAARRGRELSSHLYAAEALVQTYGGKGATALSGLGERVKALDAEGKASSLLYLTLGLIQTDAGDLERARDSLEKAMALAPDDPRVHAALGAVYRRRGQDSQAWKSYDFALRYGKDHPESLLGKSLLMLERESPNLELAASMLKKLLEADPPPSPRQLAAAHLIRSLFISRVLEAFERMKPESQGKLAEATGVPLERERALQELTRAEETGFQLDPRNPELLLIKGWRLLAAEQYEAAAAEIRRAIALDGTRAHYHVELARALLGKPGGEAEAVEALTTALAGMGDNPHPRLMVMLGNAYRAQGKSNEALAAYKRAFDNPRMRNPEARLRYGSLLREREDWAGAQEVLEKAAQDLVGDATRSAEALTELARVHAGRGDAKKAEDAFMRALKADEDYPPAYFHYAEWLGRDPLQARKARELARQYLRLDPRGAHASAAERLASN